MKAVKYAVAGLLAGCAWRALFSSRQKSSDDGQIAFPWMDENLSADERADLLLAEMRQDEKFSLVHGIMSVRLDFLEKQQEPPPEAEGSAGYIPGIPRLGIPPLQETDAGLGIANPNSIRKNDVVTAMPASLATAASFDPQIAYAGGAMIGAEARAKGFNVLLAGGVNLARDPRNGRNFEYLGEDPLLAGLQDGATISGIQDQHVISTIKHFAINDQETNRHHSNSVIGEAAMRESDLLAFQIAIEKGQPGSVMCAYNLVNGAYAGGNSHLLNDVLKGDWAYPGWVMSDWGAVHELDYAVKGLDQQSAVEFDIAPFFVAPLQAAVKSGEIPQERLDDMVRRILRSMFAVGVIDFPPEKSAIDRADHARVARETAEAGMVLLKNDGVLPLSSRTAKIAVIGGYADTGVMAGGGSSQVEPEGSLVIPMGGEGAMGYLRKMLIHPSAPLKAIRETAADSEVRFCDGRYLSEAKRLAAWADVAIVFATKWDGEGLDSADISLPDGQDQLIAETAKSAAKTIVVLETGNPVTMPWLADVSAVLEAWYPGSAGGPAIANVLFGAVCPSGRLPITFPQSTDQLPRPEIPGWDVALDQFGKNFDPAIATDTLYTEGSDVGYRWFAREGHTPLFPFGFGLSYTDFSYGALTVEGGESLTISFDVTNDGAMAGKDVPQIYLTSAAGKKLLRLIGYHKLALEPGETRRVTVVADPRLLASYDAENPGWEIAPGRYEVALARSATDRVAEGFADIQAARLKP